MNGEAPPRLTAREKRILRAAVNRGLPPSHIAEQFNTTPGAIRTALSALRQKGVSIEPFHGAKGAATSTLRIPRRTLAKLRREAKRRGLSPRQLTERIVAQVIKRGLVADLIDGSGE